MQLQAVPPHNCQVGSHVPHCLLGPHGFGALLTSALSPSLKITPMMVNLGQEAYWITLIFIIAIIGCILYYWFFDPKRLRP